jgi:hypothetical protein
MTKQIDLYSQLRSKHSDLLPEECPWAASALIVGVPKGQFSFDEIGALIAELKAVLPWEVPNLIHWMAILGTLKDWSKTFEFEDDRERWNLVVETYALEATTTVSIWRKHPEKFEGPFATHILERTEASA